MATRHKPKHSSKSGRRSSHRTPRQITAEVAKEQGVPFWILWGVKVIETGPTGTGIGAVSSAGAEGPFQFIPETAAAYHVNVNNFRSSAKGAARYLKDLHKTYGSWNTALEHYSGGGYGLPTVESKAKEGGVPPHTSPNTVLADIETPFGNIPAPGPNVNPFTFPPKVGPGTGESVGSLFSIPGEIIDAFNQFTKISKLLTDPKFWLRVGEAIAGMILLYMALKALTGTSASDIPGAKAASTAAKAAAFKRLPPAQRVK